LIDQSFSQSKHIYWVAKNKPHNDGVLDVSSKFYFHLLITYFLLVTDVSVFEIENIFQL